MNFIPLSSKAEEFQLSLIDNRGIEENFKLVELKGTRSKVVDSILE